MGDEIARRRDLGGAARRAGLRRARASRLPGFIGSARSTQLSPRDGLANASPPPLSSNCRLRLARASRLLGFIGSARLRLRLAKQSGFTLLELVVTLFVIALASAIVMPAIGRGTEGLRVRAEVAGFSAFLRRAREQAITSREEHDVTVDPGARVVIDESGARQHARRPLPDRITIEADPPTALTVRFFPQGFTSGGAFRLASQSGVAYRVTVDPLTGRVTNQREPSR